MECAIRVVVVLLGSNIDSSLADRWRIVDCVKIWDNMFHVICIRLPFEFKLIETFIVGILPKADLHHQLNHSVQITEASYFREFLIYDL